MNPLICYLFGYERYVACRACLGTRRFMTNSRLAVRIWSWVSCELCDPGEVPERGWYYRW